MTTTEMQQRYEAARAEIKAINLELQGNSDVDRLVARRAHEMTAERTPAAMVAAVESLLEMAKAGTLRKWYRAGR